MGEVGAWARLACGPEPGVGPRPMLLHTWGRQLQHHPHVHYIVPGGGLSLDGKKWISARQRDWLLAVAKLAAVFARRMEEATRALAPALHAALPTGTWRRRWVVHCQPAGSGEGATSASASAATSASASAVARYVSRTAISDERIVAADDERVVLTTPTRRRSSGSVARSAPRSSSRAICNTCRPPASTA